MALKIIKNQILEWKPENAEGAVFLYKKISSPKIIKLLFQFTENGKLKSDTPEEMYNLGLAFMQKMVYGTREIEWFDEGGAAVEKFESHFLEDLPMEMPMFFFIEVVTPLVSGMVTAMGGEKVEGKTTKAEQRKN